MNVLAAWQSLLGPDPQVSTHTATTTYVTAANGSRHVLKRVDGLRDLGERRFRLVSEYRVLLHLSAADVPVALPALTDDGRIFASAGESIYTLTPTLPVDAAAESALHSSAVYARIGAALGRLHEALRTYPHDVPSWTIDLVPRTFDEAVRDVASQLDPPLVDELAILERRRTQLIDAMTDLPTQRIHGDFHGGNVLVHEGEVSGIVDLDHLPLGPRIYDLAYFLANQFAIPAVTLHTGQLLDACRQLVAGYSSTSELTGKELAGLVPVLLAVQFQLIGWNLTQPGYTWSQDHVDGLRWIDQHYDELLERTESTFPPC